MSETANAPVRKSIPRNENREGRKENQLPIAMIVLLVMIAAGILLSIFQSFRAPECILMFGADCSALFCRNPVSALRPACVIPVSRAAHRITKAVLIAFALTTIGFTAIKYSAYASGQTIPWHELCTAHQPGNGR